MRVAQACRWIAVAVVALAAMSAGAPAKDLTGRNVSERCRWADLEDPRPLWVSWMVWNASGSRLLVPDPLSGEIFVYGPDGALQQRLRRPGRGGLEYLQPGKLVVDGTGFLVQVDSSRFIRLSVEGEPVGTLDLGTRRFPEGERVGVVLDWAVSGDWIYSFGHVRQGDGSWWTGWFRFTPEGEPGLERIRTVASRDPEHFFYTLGFQYVARVGDRAYLLMMEPEPYVLEVDGDHRRRLTALPEGFERRAELPAVRGFEDEARLMAAIERAAMPVGLFGVGGRLFVLTRRPAGEGRTVWELTGIDPEADRVVSSVTLPTTAPHLVGAPGPERWAFLEKGSVVGIGDQPIETLLFIPENWLWASSTDPCGARDWWRGDP